MRPESSAERKQAAVRTATLLILLLLLALAAFPAGPARADTTLGPKGYCLPRDIPTDDGGTQLFYANRGLYEGKDGLLDTSNNYAKIFGQNRPTTLWNFNRRADCYEKALRIMAAMPALRAPDPGETVQSIAGQAAWQSGKLQQMASVLAATKTNYVSGAAPMGQASNKIAQVLRKINPKSRGGIKLRMTNMQGLSIFLEGVSDGAMLYDFAVGAALQEALAGDLALARIDLMEALLRGREAAGVAVDPAIYEGLVRARASLTRNEHYFGALATEISDRKTEVAAKGVSVVVGLVHKAMPKVLTHYLTPLLGAQKAAVIVAKSAGVWAFAITATVEVILRSLEQHEQIQTGATASTLAYIIDQEAEAGRLPDDPTYTAMRMQCEQTYYHQMTLASSGLLASLRDVITPGHDYKDSREYFSEMETIAVRNLPTLSDMIEPGFEDGPAGEASLSGRLISRGGLPVAEAYVFAVDADGAFLGYAATLPGPGPDAGTFRLDAIPAGQPVTLLGFHPSYREDLALASLSPAGPDHDCGDLTADGDAWPPDAAQATPGLPALLDAALGGAPPSLDAAQRRTLAGHLLSLINVQASQGRSILIILDTSSSMDKMPRGDNRSLIDGAKESIRQLVQESSDEVEWALIVFNDCSPKVAVDFTTDKQRLLSAVASARTGGKTPLAKSLLLANRYLQQNGAFALADVILLSDGEETCGGDPESEARSLHESSADYSGGGVR